MLEPSPLPLLLGSLAGLVAGSFLNVVIHRGPSMWGLVDGEKRGDFAAPRSYCPRCGATLGPADLVPIVSYLLLKGRCRRCRAPIPWRYPAVEALGGLVAAASLLAFGIGWPALFAAAFGMALVALAFIDLETGYLPDALTLPLAAAGLAANAFGLFATFADAAIGTAAGYLAFRAVGLLFEKIRGEEGLGEGDAKLLAAIGAWGGWAALPFVVFAAAAATLAVALARRKPAGPIAFGPGLCAAGFVALLASAAVA
jgi:leader peptidase (prepilin peptidase)/N-methyltransferase